jgi:hypothetical protein
MSPHSDLPEQDEYRLMFVRSGSRAVWTERGQNGPRLPRVVVPRWRRPAEQLQEAIQAVWKIRVIVLDFLPVEERCLPCAIVEVLSAESALRLTATTLDEIPMEEMNLEEREVIQAILDDEVGTRGPLSRLGWISEAIVWLREEVGDGVSVSDEIKQYNAGGRFALVCIGSPGGPIYWLKATGEPNAREFLITRKLVEVCPEYLPPQIASRNEWNAWLMEDFGRPLCSTDLPAVRLAILSMARLQTRTLDWTGELLAAGAFDQRVGTLLAHLSELMDYLREAMVKQTSTKVRRLDQDHLSRLESTLRDACFRMEDLKIPDTLVHNDVNPGNILFKGPRCVFTDWCEAGVSNPFFGFEYLCLLQSRGGGSRRVELQEVYRQCWLERLSSSQIDMAFTLSRPLAILSHFYGNGTWLRSSRRNEPRIESYARSLGRHMHSAIQTSSFPEVLCQ